MMHNHYRTVKIFSNNEAEIFEDSFKNISDNKAKTLILRAIDNLALNIQNVKDIGAGLYEIYVDYNGGYYIYLTMDHDQFMIICCGDQQMKASLMTKSRQFINNEETYPYRDYEEFRLEILLNVDMAKQHLEIAITEFINNSDNIIFIRSIMQLVIVKGGVEAISKKTGLNRRLLHKALLANYNPKIDVYGAIIRGLGFKIAIHRC